MTPNNVTKLDPSACCCVCTMTAGAGAVSVGSLALFAGGMGRRVESQVIDIYDAAANRWSSAKMSMPRKFVAACAVDTGAPPSPSSLLVAPCLGLLHALSASIIRVCAARLYHNKWASVGICCATNDASCRSTCFLPFPHREGNSLLRIENKSTRSQAVSRRWGTTGCRSQRDIVLARATRQ